MRFNGFVLFVDFIALSIYGDILSFFVRSSALWRCPFMDFTNPLPFVGPSAL